MSDGDPLTFKKKRVSQRKCKSVKKRFKVGNDSKTKVENNHFERLPDEILLKIVDYLHIADLLRCGQTCRKIRTVVHDESLWKKVNFTSDSLVPTGLLQLVLEHGCEYLNISDQLVGNLTLNQDSKLKFLNLDLLDSCYIDVIMYRSKMIAPLMTSCHSLEKLQLTNLDLNSSLIKTICTQNSKTLKVLNLNWCTSPSSPYMQLSVIQPIIDECVELEELTFFRTRLSEGSIDYLVKNITPKLSKLCLFTNLVQDKHIEVLVGRCTKLTELNLVWTGITTDSLKHIIEKLETTLEKLSLPGRFLLRPEHFTKLFELKAMKKLTVLDLSLVLMEQRDLVDKLESLRRQVPNAEILHKHIPLGKQVLGGNFRCY